MGRFKVRGPMSKTKNREGEVNTETGIEHSNYQEQIKKHMQNPLAGNRKTIKSLYGVDPEYFSTMPEEEKRHFFKPEMLRFLDHNEYFQVMPGDDPRRRGETGWDNMMRRGGPLSGAPTWKTLKGGGYQPQPWMSIIRRPKTDPSLSVHEGRDPWNDKNPVHPELPWYQMKVDF